MKHRSATKRRNHSKDSELLMVLSLIRLKFLIIIINVCSKYRNQQTVRILTCGSILVSKKIRQKQNIFYSKHMQKEKK